MSNLWAFGGLFVRKHAAPQEQRMMLRFFCAVSDGDRRHTFECACSLCVRTASAFRTQMDSRSARTVYTHTYTHIKYCTQHNRLSRIIMMISCFLVIFHRTRVCARGKWWGNWFRHIAIAYCSHTQSHQSLSYQIWTQHFSARHHGQTTRTVVVVFNCSCGVGSRFKCFIQIMVASKLVKCIYTCATRTRLQYSVLYCIQSKHLSTGRKHFSNSIFILLSYCHIHIT